MRQHKTRKTMVKLGEAKLDRQEETKTGRDVCTTKLESIRQIK